MKKLKKALAVALCAALAFQLVHPGVLAAPIPVNRAVGGERFAGLDTGTLDRGSIEDDEYDALIIDEMTELREESVRPMPCSLPRWTPQTAAHG